MIIKGRTSKNLRGSLCVPTIAQKAMLAGETFEIDEKQYWAPDVQRAAQTKKIVFTSKVPAESVKVIVTNVTDGSITLLNHGVIRSGCSVRISKEEATKPDVRKLFASGKLSLDGKKKSKTNKCTKAVVVDYKEKKSKKKDFNPITWTPEEEEEQSDEDEENGDIKFVDIEDTKRRLQNHPILGKKYGKDKNSKGKKTRQSKKER